VRGRFSKTVRDHQTSGPDAHWGRFWTCVWLLIRALFLTLVPVLKALALAAVIGPVIIAFLPLGTFEVLAL